jgi:hypothetical protein
MQCSLVAGETGDRPEPRDIANLKRLTPTGPCFNCRVASATVDAGPTPELTVTNVTNARVAQDGPRKIRKRLEALKSGPSMVGDTGIEPVTPTVSR